MAAPKDATRVDVQNIKTDLSSISTCTSGTVSKLQELLAEGSRESQEGSKEPQQRENAKPSRAKPVAVPLRSRRKPVAADSEVRGATSGLTRKEKYMLATEVANSTLKSLSDSLKDPSILRYGKQPRTRTPALKSTPNDAASKQRGTLSRSSSYLPRALQDLPVSQVVNSPRKPSSLRRSSSYSSSPTTGHAPGLLATAECARVAFAYLRSSEDLGMMAKNTPQLQLENGMIALIGKLVGHGLDNLAAKELRILKRRLELYLGGPENDKGDQLPKAPAKSKKTSTTTDKETLASLLAFENLDSTTPALPLIIQHQLYTLKVIATLRRPRIIESVVDYVQDSNASSPPNLILQYAKTPNSAAKAARQLESLAQSLLSMCPSVSSSEDELACKESLKPSPDAVLRLQHLAFGIRQKWWKLSKHQGSVDKELCEPFSRCLAAFSRRSSLPAQSKYTLANTLYQDLCGQLEGGQAAMPSVFQASKVLSSLAQAASLPDEALLWTEGCEPTDASNASAAKVTARLVRKASLSFEAAFKRGTSNSDWEQNVDTALQGLAGSLGGSSIELENLFAEVNGFRRIATKTLITKPPQNFLESKRSFYIRAFSIIAASMRFVVRYVGSQPSETPDPKLEARQAGRIGMAIKIIKSSLDSAIICSRQFFEFDIQWALLDEILQDFVTILHRVENCVAEHGSSVSGSYQELQLPFVKVSNAYWTSYLQLRKTDDHSPYLLQAMQKSVDILLPRSKAERNAGLVSMKLEKLGEALDSINRPHEARAAFHESITNLIESGDLRASVELASKMPLHSIFDIDGSFAALARLLRLNHHSFIKDGISGSELAFFDDKSLSAAERGLIMEWQVSLFFRTLSKNRTWDLTLNSSVQTLANRLKEIYSATKFPVRRRRTYIALLELADAHPDVLAPELLGTDDEAEVDDPTGTLDNGLYRYNEHLKATIKIKLALRGSSPAIAPIKGSLHFWQSLLDSTTTWADLLEHIDNPDSWIQQLQAIADFLAVKGEEYLSIPVLNLMNKALELRRNSDTSLLVSTLSRTGLQLLRLGYSGKAGLAFAKAQGFASSSATSTEAKLQWHLAYAEYLLKIGNSEKCESTLISAEDMAVNDAEFMELSKPSATLSGRIRFNTLLASACYVYSLLSLNKGCYKDALRHAKRCIGLSRRVWATLENRSKPTQTDNSNIEAGQSTIGSFDPLSSVRTDKGVPVVMSITHQSLDGAEFWFLVPLLHQALSLQAQVFAHLGLLQEAIYMCEQADKVASATNSPTLILESASHQIEYWAQSGRPDKAQAAMDSASRSLVSTHHAVVKYHSSVARLYHSSEKFQQELKALDNMCSIVQELQLPSFLKELESLQPTAEALAARASEMSLVTSKAEDKKPMRTTRGRKPTVKTVPKSTPRAVTKSTVKPVAKPTQKAAAAITNPTVPSISEECSQLNSLRADATRRRALVNIAQDNILKAAELLEQAGELDQGFESRVLHLCAKFKVLFAQSMNELATDFTFNALPESTIAFPALFQSDRALSEAFVAKVANLSTSPSTVKPPPTQRGKGKKPIKTNFIATLQQAKYCIAEAHALVSRGGSSSMLTQVSCALSNVTVLLSAATQGETRGSLHPLYAAYTSELPKWLSMKMTQTAIEVEQEALSREEIMKWPEIPSQPTSALPSAKQFQHDYVDIIPDAWTAISLALSEDHDDLYITRYHAGQSPFVLRLPMSRHKSRDMDEEEFGFDDGRKDFDEIIELSDFSTKSAREMTAKGAKTQWWAEREALDTRLKELLLNIENIWLGGFKGIFSQHQPDPNLLARFKKSFQNILNKHLPSRQGRGQLKKVSLEPRILELFVGLGDATNEDLDLDEALMDLIYFVVDILQFNGERNAYDEIDFDAMVIETLDALRAYHTSARNVATKPSHTILILDKNLHALPWESLPCLQSLSISRLPSLAALRDRIMAAKISANAAGDAQPGHYISASAGGASMLNPGGDLASTAKTIKPRLDDITGEWTHIVNRAPSEAEFENALREKELVLYFGHGSGAQFVRSKTVKKLYQKEETAKRCATAFLFGCSSAHLTENGIYEPSGMLASYLAAGAPAVVGMLWDVTDKDCDRFAVRAGELWGLWPEAKEGETLQTRKSSKGKGRVTQKVADVENPRGAGNGRGGRKGSQDEDEGDEMDLVGGDERKVRREVGLDEAVRDAREACYLRYLNGAAAVVYGIPCYLE
ncbi:hypothetical protein GQ43DRAFT_491012 [Delitschia confertaspora ATCC 74209]|uniref:separase n=1 Tax=Delitschia confertaspora ATCC 74209 TaxID=1513339 RepID=A0A9P4JIF3_9PLEO|nr:hypothetical protein GQ43DRAFT_491012 [Delitschia confertaspora ATCC 74209]